MSYIQLPLPIKTMQFLLPNLKIYYPYLTQGTNTGALQNMNRGIINLVYSLIVEQGYYQDPLRTQVTGYFEIKTNERGVLSLSIINYTYQYHAAHGLTIIKSLNFDIKDGRNQQLHELFKPGSNYEEVLSGIVKEQIEERDIPLINQFEGVKPDQDYYIADQVLVIYYQLYDLTPYVYGFPQFPVAVYEIQDILKKDGLLGVMLVNG